MENPSFKTALLWAPPVRSSIRVSHQQHPRVGIITPAEWMMFGVPQKHHPIRVQTAPLWKMLVDKYRCNCCCFFVRLGIFGWLWSELFLFPMLWCVDSGIDPESTTTLLRSKTPPPPVDLKAFWGGVLYRGGGHHRGHYVEQKWEMSQKYRIHTSYRAQLGRIKNKLNLESIICDPKWNHY